MMSRTHVAMAVTLGLCALAGSTLVADVRTDDKALVRFEGALGRVINLFGGKAAKEGVKTTIALKGDRKATFGDSDGTIVDLKEEKVYVLDMKRKSYGVMTFADMRRRMEEARTKAEEEAKKAEAEEAKETKEVKQDVTPGEKPPEVDIDFDVKETGQRKSINGFDTKEVVMTITMREKGKPLEQIGRAHV